MQYSGSLQLLGDYVTNSLAMRFPGHPVLGVINAEAGTAARHRAVRRLVEELSRSRTSHFSIAMQNPPRAGKSGQVLASTVWTDSVSALNDVMGRWLDRVDSKGRGKNVPIVASFGGDGTHNRVMQAAGDAGERLWFFRVPLGSGNDAVGDASLREVLISLDSELTPVWCPAVEVKTPRRTLSAFNIASVGIDAYVTMMHHRLRGLLPGNTYRIIANLAVLVYERLVDLTPLSVITAEEDLGERVRVLLAFGVHGHLTYGDHIRILPGEENLCVFDRVSLREKLRMKRLLFHGDHVTEPITTMCKTESVRLGYTGRLPVQVDGESEWLEADDFPLTMRTMPRARRVLQPARLASGQNHT